MGHTMIQAQTEDHRHHPIGATLAAVHPGLRHYDEKKATKQSSGEFILRDCGSGYVEELYWSKNVVILSRRHHHNGHAHFVRSFTRKTRILKCMWCTFEGAKWLAIIEKRRGTFIASSDESTPFLEMALPFSVQAAYAAEPECGLVLNAVSAGGNGGPSMFYVKHPMNDIKPIWIDKPLVPLQGTLTHGAHVGGALWLVVSHKGQSTIYQLDSISVAEKASIKTSEMASNVAMETTTTKEAPTPPNTTPQQQPTPKTPQRTRKLSTHSSTPFRTPIRTGQKSTMLHHRPQLNTTPRRQRHSSIVSFQDSFYFSDRTSQYMTQPANQRLLWPSHVARRLTTVSVMPKAKVNGHSDIRKRHFLLIGSDNRLLVVDLANGKVNEVDQVNEFTTLNNYFLVISRDLQSSLYTGMINLGKVNLNEHISTVLGHQSSKRSDIVEKALMASTPVMKRERLFSTPNVPPKAKLKGVFSPGFSPGPVPGYSGQNKAFVTPDLSQRSQKLIVLSHPLNNSVTLAKAKSVRLTLDLDYTNQQTPAIILWRMIEHTVESEHFYKMVGDWLIAKSTGKSTFRHLITFFVDCFVDQGDAEPHLNKKRKSDQIDDCATDLAAAWSPDFLRELGLEAKTMPKLSSEKLDTFYRVLFVVKEELQLSTDYASEAGFISEILPASYRHSPVMRILNATLNQTMTECHRMPMNYRLNPVTCVVVNLYLIVHYGISPSTTRQLVALDVVDFIKSGKTGHFKLNMSPSTNTHMLFQLLEHVSSSSWDSLPLPIVAPIRRHLVHLSRQSSLTKTQSLCIRRLLADHHAVLPHPRRHPDHSKIEDGLECLDGRGFTKFIFPEDLRTQSARALLSTYQPLTSSQLGISRHQQHTQLKVEQTFVEMSQRTVAKMFGRALATFSQSTINPVVDRFKEPKADFSLKLEQALIQAGLFSPDLASAGTLSRQELADPWSEWPFYHNSVACGLSLSDGLSLNSSWLIWNKPEKLGTLSYSTVARVAGGLLGICLRGYLELSPLQTILKFTQDRKPLILVSLFLGLCASKKYAGSRNDSLLRLLTIHLPAKFLVNKTEDLLQMTLGIQCAAILALGFLFRNDKREIRHVSNISRYVDLMLDEINKEPDAERDMPNGRESYATAAGFSVGLLLLGAGNDSSLRSLNIVNRLNTLITGGENKTNEASYIMENDQINPWVVKTGAMSATALIFLGTGDRVIASWFDIPASAKLLEAIRPIDLMMMVITKHMILIKHIEPSATWIEQLKPPVIAQNPLSAETLEKWKVRSPAIDYSVTAMADLSINVGAAFVLGLKYAGTHEPAAVDAIKAIFAKVDAVYVSHAKSLPPDFMPIGHLRQSLATILLSWSLIVAGSGDVELFGHLHRYATEVPTVGDQVKVNFGQELAIHQAIGFTFLGACEYSLASDRISLATLFIALVPKYPTDVDENYQILQAQRHLSVLAAQKRLVVPISVSGETLVEPVEIELESGHLLKKTLPGIIPIGAKRVTFFEQKSCRDLTSDEIGEIIAERKGRFVIGNHAQSDRIVALERQFELDGDNEKLAHVLHLAKYNDKFNEFVDSYAHLHHNHRQSNNDSISGELGQFNLDEGILSTMMDKSADADVGQSVDELASQIAFL